MASADATYDLTLMLDTSAQDAARAKIVTDVEQLIAAGGSVVGHHDWGVRTTAYEIRHKTDAHYHLLQFHATPELLKRLDRTLRITDGVVRHRIIRLAPGTGEPPEVKPEPRPATPAAAPAPPAAEAAPAPDTPPAAPAPDVPADTPPADTPPADTPPADAPPADAPPAEDTPDADPVPPAGEGDPAA